VNIEDADGLSEELFTALIAEIHARDAEQVLLKEGTHDVAVLSKKTGNMLIRCKKALGATLPGAENAIQEITRAKGYYEERTAQPFPHRALYSNVKKYSAAALEAAKFQQVRLYTRKHLEAALKQHEIAYESILRRNISRMNYEL
ncbi:MAG: hypothetical protein GY862_11265, partial [Gammaproteobacteria bacterium]|nr:hypothetical protein [Gammaproteobacteria bacterium]